MIEFLLALLQESPVLFLVLVVNLVIVTYIVVRISLYITHKKHPRKIISHFFWKMKAKKGREEIKTIEDLYPFIMDSLRKEGTLGKQEKNGLVSRRKALSSLEEGEKKKILKNLFILYEAKVYGKGRILNEQKLVSDILNSYTTL